MLILIKHRLIKIIEKIPLLQIFIYNYLQYWKFLFPHDKDYYALKLLFKKNEKRTFLDIGANIGLSTIGFRELGFLKNKIIMFEPDQFLSDNYLTKVIKNYSNIEAYPFGLSNKSQKKKLFRAFYKNVFFHFNNSFNLNYLKEKLEHNYGNKAKKFIIKPSSFKLKKFDELKIKENICFIKIDVEGFDELVLYGMKNFFKKNNPVVLVEYNKCNFSKIYEFLKNKYDCFFYDFDKNKLQILKTTDILKLIRGEILESKYKKNSVNIFFINKNKKLNKRTIQKN
jgi:FkbM family methyltransferase